MRDRNYDIRLLWPVVGHCCRMCFDDNAITEMELSVCFCEIDTSAPDSEEMLATLTFVA